MDGEAGHRLTLSVDGVTWALPVPAVSLDFQRSAQVKVAAVESSLH